MGRSETLDEFKARLKEMALSAMGGHGKPAEGTVTIEFRGPVPGTNLDTYNIMLDGMLVGFANYDNGAKPGP